MGVTRRAKAEVTDSRCSFCGKDGAAVAKLVAGPGVYICNECVQVCNEILEAEATTIQQRRSPARLPLWLSQMSDDEVLQTLPRIAATVGQVEADLTAWVRRARTRGIAWARIGEALEMTRQSAWERFSGED